MSEAVTPPVEGTPPPVEAPPSGLPSDAPAEGVYDGFNLNDDQKALFKDGKLNGRFGSIDEVLTKVKEAEDYKAQNIREQKEGGEQQQQQQQQSQADQTKVEKQNAVISELLPTFMENGMTLTPEMEARLTDGLTGTEKELAIYKFRDGARMFSDRITSAHSIAGGKENYVAMQEWAKENLDEKQKIMFTHDVDGSPQASQIAVEWLHDKYQKAIKDGSAPRRIEGTHHTSGLRPYADRKELYKDKDYVESPAGRRDTAAQKQYRARMKITPDTVIFGNR